MFIRVPRLTIAALLCSLVLACGEEHNESSTPMPDDMSPQTDTCTYGQPGMPLTDGAPPARPAEDASVPMPEADLGLDPADAAAGPADAALEPTDAALPPDETGCAPDLAAAFGAFGDRVTVRCVGDVLQIDSPDGFPRLDPPHQDERMMVGITSWILRIPVPALYEWRLPLSPRWLDAPEQASPRGPIAVAINGVPIFHYEARPDGSTLLADYDAGSDTVVRGELDHCGGHAGQGDDYHYHYAPICLLDRADLTKPIAFGLDGAPIYFGTGGTDYFGNGRYTDINRLPNTPLDDCNAIRNADGSYTHYTTSTPPYLIGCHHGYADPALRIEPRPMRRQREDSPYGGQVGEPISTLVTDFEQDGDGYFTLTHEAFQGDGYSAIRVRAQDDQPGCYEFEFREDAEQAGVFQTHCRP